VAATVGEAGDRVSSRTKIIVVGVVAAIIGGALALFAPKLLGWAVGGTVAGATTLYRAGMLRRKADTAHAAAIKAENAEVDALQASANEAVDAATERADTPPTDEGDPEARRRALADAAGRLR
jgi:hypothetical protein